MNERLKALADAGVSIWLDDLSRERITSGNLADLVQLLSQRSHDEPDDLRRGAVQGTRQIRSSPRNARSSRRHQGADHRRCTRCL